MFVVVLVFITMITVLIGNKVLTEFKGNINQTDILNQTYFESGEDALSVFNIGIIFIFVMGIIGAVILAFYIRTHPVFIAVSLIILVVMVAIVAPIINNMYFEFAEHSEISATASPYNYATILFQNLPLFTAIGAILVMVALYGKLKGEERSA